jgi:hypothetical protein
MGIPVTGQIYERALVNSHHLLLLVAVLVFCLVMFFGFVRESRKIKFNITFDPKLAVAYGLGDLVAFKPVRFQFVGRCLTHKINSDWPRSMSGIRDHNLDLGGVEVH